MKVPPVLSKFVLTALYFSIFFGRGLLHSDFPAPFCESICVGAVLRRGRSISFPESLRKLAGVVISCILCDLRNGLCAPDKLYGSLFQTVFLDIVVYWHTVDLFEHFFAGAKPRSRVLLPAAQGRHTPPGLSEGDPGDGVPVRSVR